MINECCMKDCYEPVYAITGILNDDKTTISEGHHCLGHYQELCSQIAVELFTLNGMIVMKDGKPVDFNWMKTTIFTKKRKK